MVGSFQMSLDPVDISCNPFWYSTNVPAFFSVKFRERDTHAAYKVPYDDNVSSYPSQSRYPSPPCSFMYFSNAFTNGLPYVLAVSCNLMKMASRGWIGMIGRCQKCLSCHFLKMLHTVLWSHPICRSIC